ncbi:MAG: precorrin-2 C(20)-methyltransferase [Oscillibacter sp.]|nr:precorrin-2 C(20)-methyltransferase [Oscillibacter sp.]
MEMRKGVLYGVSVGPGDPELLTLKALCILQKCPIIAAPQTKSGETLALDIVRQAVSLEEKTVLPLYFPMGRDKSRWSAAHEQAAEEICARLDAGQDVAVPNLGDVSIYSTFGYLMDLLRQRGYEAVMIPGVPSFCAAAARLGTVLVSGDTPLHIIPANSGSLMPLLELPGAKVLMKAGRDLPQTVQALRKAGQLERAALVENCGLPNEKIFPKLEPAAEKAGYFTTILVKER